jgi:hypothetical protein
VRAAEQDRPDVAAARTRWRSDQPCQEGFDEIADWFETLAKAGKSRAGRFQKALDALGSDGSIGTFEENWNTIGGKNGRRD